MATDRLVFIHPINTVKYIHSHFLQLVFTNFDRIGYEEYINPKTLVGEIQKKMPDTNKKISSHLEKTTNDDI